MPKIILLRGNSGSGKSTIAKELQEQLGPGTLLIQQDTVRRDMLMAKDRADNPAIGLLINLIEYGAQNCDITILEGILYSDIYAQLFTSVRELFGTQVFAYYFDIPFEITLARHKTKAIAHRFGEAEMRRWWRDNDRPAILCEKTIRHDMSPAQTVTWILADFQS